MNEIVSVAHMTETDEVSTPNKPVWQYVVDTEGKPLGIHVRCTCGKWVTPGNKILEDGTLIGSFYHWWPEHPNEGCGWHVYLKLKDYQPHEH